MQRIAHEHFKRLPICIKNIKPSDRNQYYKGAKFSLLLTIMQRRSDWLIKQMQIGIIEIDLLDQDAATKCSSLPKQLMQTTIVLI